MKLILIQMLQLFLLKVWWRQSLVYFYLQKFFTVSHSEATNEIESTIEEIDQPPNTPTISIDEGKIVVSK